MMTILKTLLEVTAYAAVLFIVIATASRMLRKRLSASLRYLLWLLFVTRLLIPVTVDSGIRLFTLPAAQTVAAVVPEAAAEDDQSDLSFMASPETTARAAQPETVQNATPSDTGSGIAAAAAPRMHVDWPTMGVLVWVSGIAVYFAVTAWLHGRFCRIIRSALPAPDWVIRMADTCAKELSLWRPVRVRVLNDISSPALTLSLRPKLLLPQNMLNTMSRDQVALGIRHELTHYKRRDHLMSLLLLIMRGIYWFNPVVWVARFMILDDMEAACDARATAGLKKQQRNLYATTIIDLGSDAFAHCALGMGQTGKKQAERRIRGLFGTRRSGRAARLAVALLAVLMFVACFTTACQPTPEEPIVVYKGQDLENLVGTAAEVPDTATAAQTEDAGALYEKLGAPKHWTMETQEMDGRLNISADVDVELPAVSALPAATAVLREFSQQEIEKVVSTVLGDGLTFTESVDWTKERLDALILEIKQNIAMQQEGKNPGTGVYYDERDLEVFQGLLADAPSESELAIKDLRIETVNDYGQNYQGIRVSTTVDGQPYIIRAGDIILPEAVHSIRIATGNRYGAYFDGTYLDAPYGVSLTKEDAGAQAQAIASQLTDELTLCYVVPTATSKQETDRNWGWACVFMREINGCPTAYATEDVGSSMESEEQKPVRYEKMVIVMDDLGITSFTWENPMTVTSIDNADVEVLPFDEIAEKAVKQLAIFHKVDVQSEEGEFYDVGCTVHITRVELGLMRVMKADSSEYYYIPVWNFYSDIEHTAEYKDKYNKGDDYEEAMAGLTAVDEKGNPECMVSGYPQAWGAVTINALNGSVIDRDLGY